MKLRSALILPLVVAGLMAATAVPASALQCVPYARLASGITIRGDAWTWWKNAGADYSRGTAPKSGSVLVFQRSGKMQRGHVAVVRDVVTPREVVIDHANWAGHRSKKGQIDRGVRVIDVSDRNDWSAVRVWYRPAGDFGTRVYPTYGFIYAGKGGGDTARDTAVAGHEDIRQRALSPPSRMAGVAPHGIKTPTAEATAPVIIEPVSTAAPGDVEGDTAGYDAVDLDAFSDEGLQAPTPRARPAVPRNFVSRQSEALHKAQRGAR